GLLPISMDRARPVLQRRRLWPLQPVRQRALAAPSIERKRPLRRPLLFYPACSARHTVSAVAGICTLATAASGSALAIALSTAGGAAVVPASPVPLTPSGLVRHGTARWATANTRRSLARGMT